MTQTDPRLGTAVVHRRYVPHGHAHYAGGLVDGAYVLGLCGDVATELCVRTDGDEGLLAGYAEVAFHAPVQVGDVVQVYGEVTRVGRRSRTVALRASVVCRAAPGRGAAAADVCDPPLLVLTATGTVVVPGPAGD